MEELDKVHYIFTDYKNWLQSLSKHLDITQLNGTLKLNSEMLAFYWLIGRDIQNIENSCNLNNLYERISKDITKVFPDKKSFSPRNLLYMHQFYHVFDGISTLIQAEGSDNFSIVDTLSPNSHDPLLKVFRLPWRHICSILDKCGSNTQKALFYVEKTIENNWSQAVLQNFLNTDLFELQGKAITNFQNTLPAIQSELAQEITKDPYIFDFFTLREHYTEKELKDQLMANITKFLLELGTGFSFIGRECRVIIGGKESFIDILFFNIRLKCYVVLDVKVTDFNSSFAGKLGTYVVAVNHQLKEE